VALLCEPLHQGQRRLHFKAFPSIEASADELGVVFTVDSAMLYGALVYFLIFSITLGYLIRHGRNSWPRRILQLLAALAWPLYWPVIVGVPGTIAILLSAVGDVLRSGSSLFATTDEALGRPGETLRWLYFLPLVGFPMFYIYGHWKVDDSWANAPIVIMKAFLWAPFWPVYLIASLYYG
jgi:hypothetical protein